MESHARQAFSVEIQQLEHDLLEMASRAESMVGQAVEALCTVDPKLALEVIQRDDEIDQLDLEIESRCLRLLIIHIRMENRPNTLRAVFHADVDDEQVERAIGIFREV